jgi:hypothetical protein
VASSKVDKKQLEALLQDRTLNLGDIGIRLGITRERVRQLQAKYYPDLRRRRGESARKDYAQYDDLLLSDISIQEIAEKFHVSENHARVLRRKAQERHNVVGQQSIRRNKQQFHKILREAGSAWCWVCLQVKDLEEFMPASKTDTGLPCRQCNTERCRKYVRNNPKHKAAMAKYQQENKRQIRAYQKQWRERNADHVRDKATNRLLEKIEQQSPELAEKVRAGQISAYEATMQLNLRKRWVRHEVSVKGFLKAISRHLSPTEQAELKTKLE